MGSVTTKIGKDGRIVIPAEYRKALGIRPGEDVVLVLENDEVRVFTRRQAVKRVQKMVRKRVPEGVSLVDELLRERREEAARE